MARRTQADSVGAARGYAAEKKSASTLLVEDWPLERIKPYAGNPRKRSKHAVAKVAASIREFGFRQPIVVDEAGEIIVGHTRLDAAVSLGRATAPVHQALGLSEQQKRAYRIADNRTNEETEWDEALLALEGLDGFDLSPTGLDAGELNGLLRGGPQEGEDEIPEPGPAVTERGDVWELGAHRLVCGDATSAEDVALVLCGEKPLLMVTDPPYGIGIVQVNGSVGVGGVPGAMYPFGGKRATDGGAKPYGKAVASDGGGDNLVKAREYYPVTGDDKPFDPRHLLNLGKEQIIFGANYFAGKLPDGKSWIVWDKEVSGNFSEVELAWTSMRGRLRLYRHMWSGLRREGPRNEELTERVHPTQKPVGLFRAILNDFSEPNVNIIDPYLGSGTTLIAAETEARRCFGLEIEPRYCDVIVKRWETFTGKTAVRHAK